MTNGLNFEVERPGFPVKIGSVELWVDDSIENLKVLLNANEIVQEKMKGIQEKAKHIHFPEDPEDIDIDDIDLKKIDAVFDINKEAVAMEYDLIFGDGSFKKIYEKHEDIRELERLLPIIGQSIGERITEREEERSEKADSKIDEYLKKKAKKAGN